MKELKSRYSIKEKKEDERMFEIREIRKVEATGSGMGINLIRGVLVAGGWLLLGAAGC